MARRRRQPAQGDLFSGGTTNLARPPDPDETREAMEEGMEQGGEPKHLFVCRPDDRPRCVLCGEPVPPDGVYSSRLDGSACPKCHDEWLKTLY